MPQTGASAGLGVMSLMIIGIRQILRYHHIFILFPNGAVAASAYLHSIPASAGKAYRMLRGNA
jgi:hypothetical protein